MFEITVTVKNEGRLRKLIDRLRRQSPLVERVMKRLREQYRPRIVAILAQEPPPSSGPVAWTSEAQRVTVLKILRKRAMAEGRADIRYIRTHRISRGYQVELARGEQPGEIGIQVINPTPYHIYVKWKWQQGFHARTGWRRDDVLLRGVQEEMAEAFADQAVVEFKEGE